MTTMIPAAIALTAMEAIMDGASTENAVFMAAIEATNDCHDREFAKAYGLKHWGELSIDSRKAWDWTFGRENRLPGWASRDISAVNASEEKILASQE